MKLIDEIFAHVKEGDNYGGSLEDCYFNEFLKGEKIKIYLPERFDVNEKLENIKEFFIGSQQIENEKEIFGKIMKDMDNKFFFCIQNSTFIYAYEENKKVGEKISFIFIDFILEEFSDLPVIYARAKGKIHEVLEILGFDPLIKRREENYETD